MTSKEVILMQRLEIAQLKSKLEKLEKVVEILKRKKPDLFKYFRNRKIYTECFVNRELTEEEYELLKGALND